MPHETEEEKRRTKGKVMLCDTAARKIKGTMMKDVKEAESDISGACAIYHKKREQKTGKPILTISEFEKVTGEFSKLSRSEIDELIKENREEHKKRQEMFKRMGRRH